MPYIPRKDRARVDAEVDLLLKTYHYPSDAIGILCAEMDERSPRFSPGEYNYAICRILLATVLKGKKSYSKLEKAIGILRKLAIFSRFVGAAGTLACVEYEVYRRYGAPYEDKKVVENGDLFEDELA